MRFIILSFLFSIVYYCSCFVDCTNMISDSNLRSVPYYLRIQTNENIFRIHVVLLVWVLCFGVSWYRWGSINSFMGCRRLGFRCCYRYSSSKKTMKKTCSHIENFVFSLFDYFVLAKYQHIYMWDYPHPFLHVHSHSPEAKKILQSTSKYVYIHCMCLVSATLAYLSLNKIENKQN